MWNAIGGIDALRAEAWVTLVVDAPWGAGHTSGAMLDVGTTLLSGAEAGLTEALPRERGHPLPARGQNTLAP